MGRCLFPFCKEAAMDARHDPARIPLNETSRRMEPLEVKPSPVSEMTCPNCGEARSQQLLWTAIDHVRCKTCGNVFTAWLNRDD